MSLTCICCKTLEHIIVSNINKHLTFESILADCQHGFRSQRSCETQLVQFFHDLVSNLDRALNRNHRQTDVIIMDFAKAFDKVPHRRLLYKLDYYSKRIYSQVDHFMALWALSKSGVRLVFPPAPKKGMVRFSKKGTFSARRHAMRALLSGRRQAKKAL